jgi:hypothetical protein
MVSVPFHKATATNYTKVLALATHPVILGAWLNSYMARSFRGDTSGASLIKILILFVFQKIGNLPKNVVENVLLKLIF